MLEWLPVNCPACAAPLSHGARFCPACGQAIAPAEAPTQILPPSPPPPAAPPPPAPSAPPPPTTARPTAERPTAPAPSGGLFDEVPDALDDEPVLTRTVFYVAGGALVVLVLFVVVFALTRHHGSPAATGGSPSPQVNAPSPSDGTSAASPSSTPSTPSPGESATATSGPATPASITVPGSAPDGRDSSGATVTYRWQNMVDGDPTTAWREEGDGSGKDLVLHFDQPVSVQSLSIINGYAKVDAKSGDNRYTEERRITAVTWTVGGQNIAQSLSPSDPNPQAVTVPPVSVTSITLHIDATTPPGKKQFDYTAISEIAVNPAT